ncbi:MAG: aminomethyltransferase beta-barrel domain-containing protein, partial [Chloroflexota bacterium]
HLSYIKLPLGRLKKDEVREIAGRFGLNVAGKPDSQETCFVGRGAYAEFVMNRRSGLDRPGEIMTPDGDVLGEHRGLIHYTVGQRKGIGVAYSEPLYVLRLDTKRNVLVVGTRDQMEFSSLEASGVSFTSDRWPAEPFECEARVRYQGTRYAAEVEPLEPGRLRIHFAEPPRAVAPGQAVVLYAGDEVLGGGTIESSSTVLELTSSAA